ncbi:hypothetical protein BDV36DRAFT_252054 [Aspergillus pseudocaelatus]|uniref:F-box domain-containing protein n=1 Tax=Aspergillus pseudocaelatus TaxID=1825620 RepID=A0ABQ6WQ03_9EURO|nr:hypothetical protein BDV36DRAFT_252054 [Aspergillus pseudocaelatus]
MLDPSRLPPELFAIIIDYATDGTCDFAALCNFALVSHQWYASLDARIYSRWLYDGKHHSISFLWKFLRTVLCNRRILLQPRPISKIRAISIQSAQQLDIIYLYLPSLVISQPCIPAGQKLER